MTRLRMDQVRKDPMNTTSPQARRSQPRTLAADQRSDSLETMRQRIERVGEDLRELLEFYNIEISETRTSRLNAYYKEQLSDLRRTHFDSYDQQEKVDYILLQNYMKRNLRQLQLNAIKDKNAESLLPFAPTIIRLCEARQKMSPVVGQTAAQDVQTIGTQVSTVKDLVKNGKVRVSKTTAFHATKVVDRLRTLLTEWFGFFNGYDPLFTWWVTNPFHKVTKEMEELAAVITLELVGIEPGEEDAITGEPVGREGLMAELEAEMIPYKPEELIQIGEREYVWCEAEIKKASHELGYGNEWRHALEHVKNQYVDPGQQPQLIHKLATEAIDYVKQNDLVTVPPLAEETIRMFMMSPQRQKVAPFFLGGWSILVSYPTDTMDHDDKLMSMRGNNIHFSRATVFHELIPGHRLQFHMNARYRPYRRMFMTPFWGEGWSLYWEFILWDKNFQKSPEDRIGMLFWRMHRCARIVFSLKFHLGQMTPQECVDFLVERVGHERSTAEGEVRRSFNGEWSPLYQAGYMLGALQLYALRQEVVQSGKMTEKQFHDRILQENQMPIELLRALIQDQKITPDFKSSWKFYED